MRCAEDVCTYMEVFGAAATRRYATGFHAADDLRRAVEVDVALPVAIVVHAAAVQPIALDPVNHVLQVGIVAVALDHDHQLFLAFVLHLQTKIVRLPSEQIEGHGPSRDR